MFRFLSLLSFAVSLTLFSSASHAGLYLEPYVAYVKGTGKLSADFPAPVNEVSLSEDMSGTAFGGKVGMSVPLIAFGVDYMATSLKLAGDYGGNFSGTHLGPFVQVALPLIKVSASYFVSSNFKSGDDTIEAKTIKVGAGFTGLPFVSLNADYLMSTSSKYKGQEVDNFDFKHGAFMIGASLPFDI